MLVKRESGRLCCHLKLERWPLRANVMMSDAMNTASPSPWQIEWAKWEANAAILSFYDCHIHAGAPTTCDFARICCESVHRTKCGGDNLSRNLAVAVPSQQFCVYCAQKRLIGIILHRRIFAKILIDLGRVSTKMSVRYTLNVVRRAVRRNKFIDVSCTHNTMWNHFCGTNRVRASRDSVRIERLWTCAHSQSAIEYEAKVIEHAPHSPYERLVGCGREEHEDRSFINIVPLCEESLVALRQNRHHP